MSDAKVYRDGKNLSCVAKALIIAAATPFLLVAVAAIWWFSRSAIANSELRDRIAALEADSMPYDDPSLQIFYNQNTAGDRAVPWNAIAEQVESQTFLDSVRDLPVLGMGDPIPADADQQWPDEAVVRDFLGSQSLLYQQLDELEPTPGGVRYPIRFEGFDTLLPAIQATRSMARLMRLRHDVAVRDRDSDAATQSVVTTLAISRSLHGHPVLVSQLVRLAIMGVATDMIRTGLHEDIYTADQLRRLTESINVRSEETEQLRIALIGERAFALSSLQNIVDGTASGVPGLTATGPHDKLAALDVFDEIMAGITTDIYDSKRNLDATSEAIENRFSGAGLLERFDNKMIGMLVPAIGAAGTAFARSEMSLRLAETAIMVRRYHFANDRWPKNLTDLKDVGFDPDLKDPLGDQPFGYEVAGPAGAVVWGFPITAMNGLEPMTETPDTPPTTENFDEDIYVFRIRLRPNTD